MGRRFFAFVGAITILGLVAACAPEPAPEPPPPAPAAPIVFTPPPPPPLPAAPVGVAAAALDPTDAPDPSIMSVDPVYCVDDDALPGEPVPAACYFAYTTQVYLLPIPVWRSTDLVHWTLVSGGITHIAPWTQYGRHWAPTVSEWPTNPADARFVMWYTAWHAASGKQCLGVAVSASPLGPFVDSSSAPAYCQLQYQGTIDPSTFVDVDGTTYLLYRSEVPAQLFSAKLNPDGRSLIAGTERLLWTGSAPDTSVVEAPTMVLVDGKYYLFYSTDAWETEHYRVGVARCTSAVGPCTRVYSTAVLASRGAMVGPGGQTPFQDTTGNWRMLFHAWTDPRVGYVPNDPRYARTMRLLPITFNGDTIRVG